MGKIKAKKVEVDGIEFDSKTEADYYKHLKSRNDVYDIVLQPQFTLLEPFSVDCDKCRGDGKVPSPKTNNPVQCSTCRGNGKRKRQSWTYSADFEVEYTSGYREVIDVKGHADAKFPYVKKMFEYTQGNYLVVVKKKGKGWVRN